MRVMSFRVIVLFVTCFSAQLERLFHGWMTGVTLGRLQFSLGNFTWPQAPAFIL
jgi:hypothetical protein